MGDVANNMMDGVLEDLPQDLDQSIKELLDNLR